jgi:hypothetical protein
VRIGVELSVEMASRRTNREEWRTRVERWKDSGLTAQQFAGEMGINAGTLQFWKYKLGKPEAKKPRRRQPRATAALVSSLIEVHPATSAIVETRFEIDLANGRRLRVPSVFDPSALKSLLAVLETAP